MSATHNQDGLDGRFRSISLDQISSWKSDNHVDALRCFLQSANKMAKTPGSTKKLGVCAQSLKEIGAIALRQFSGLDQIDPQAATSFFEEYFSPCQFIDDSDGFVTGYYEPVIKASRIPDDQFCWPVYRRPDDLIDLSDASRPADMDPYFAFGLERADCIQMFHDRAAINAGALAGKGLELFWFEDPIEVFFIHIQGSARLQFEDGSVERIAFAAKSGHRFTPIGKHLVENGCIPAEHISMQSIKDWLRSNRDQAMDVMGLNQSYIFFQRVGDHEPELGPVGAQGVQLSAGRSLAVDRKLHTFGMPVFVETTDAIDKVSGNWKRLMIAQDTGSAIVGPQRGDLFVGSGDHAGNIAGRVKSRASFTFFLPKSQVMQHT